MKFSPREEFLLRAAIGAPREAVSGWEAWTSSVKLEEAPHSELRLLPAVYANLRQADPTLKLPAKLRGKATYTFTRNHLLAKGCLPILRAIGAHSPVVVTKGLGMCLRFGTWSSREVGDVDVYVRRESLEHICGTLTDLGWAPLYGMTVPSLVHRTSLRRDSWNFTKGMLDVDLHWRLGSRETEPWLLKNMWADARKAEYNDQPLLIQSPEFSLASSLDHGFNRGYRGDALQTVLDASLLLPACEPRRLLRVIEAAELSAEFSSLLSICRNLGVDSITRAFSSGPTIAKRKAGRRKTTLGKASISSGVEFEKRLMRNRGLYRFWVMLGRIHWMERAALRLGGPFSKPLVRSAPRETYDLRSCAIMDEIAGPGWSWPEPDGTCFWSDRADCRLLIPLSKRGDHVVVLTVDRSAFHSPNATVDVFANGKRVANLDFRASGFTSFAFVVPKHLLFRNWIELSLRPCDYLGELAEGPLPHALRRSVPVQGLRILDLPSLGGLLTAELPEAEGVAREFAARLARIKQRTAQSPFRTDGDLPADFDPFWYVLVYRDLFENEVDPFEHFLRSGRREGRSWGAKSAIRGAAAAD